MVPEAYHDPATARRIGLIAASHARLLGRDLVVPGPDLVAALWQSPMAIVAHGSEPDPLFFFGNRAALAAFEATPEQFIGMPSRLSAEAPSHGERQQLLDRVSQRGLIVDYSGIRITLTGTRFHIANAVVWNLLDEQGIRHGQAAAFSV
ncbi:MAG: MEKHLA domain-containing protein [Novosphingobium sp.]